jgi:DNA-directed RNA polymerase
MLKRRVKEINPKTLRKWMKYLDDLSIVKWREAECIHIGTVCLEQALVHMDGIVDVRVTRRAHGNGFIAEKVVDLTGEFVDALREAHMDMAIVRPWLLPMVSKPVPWQENAGQVVGGYRLPWAINKFVLGIARDCFAHDLGPLPYEPDLPMPDKIDQETWESMDKAAKGKVKSKRAIVYDHNNVQYEKKLAMNRALAVAEEFQVWERIYMPHSLDWRGRAYPVPQDLHPQGSDMVKSLLRFGESKELGSSGFRWLMRNAAATYGLDKESREAQEAWATDNWEKLMLVGRTPWLDPEFWMAAHAPWQFLAVCHELKEANDSGNPHTYHSTLPVSVDGSCNGLQHLSAMGLDPVGAEAVNLTPGPRRDIYQIVADKVAATVDPESPWYGKVGRKTVKRGVMTTPYGVTPRGITKQLVSDGFTKGMDDHMVQANYLRERMWDAINDTVIKGKEVMAWMQDCAQLLGEDNQAISWTTPIGLRVTQKYTKPTMKRLATVMGRLYIEVKDPKAELSVTKQRTSVAPNIVHSFDASHMMLVILNMPSDTSFAMVHDSFGCHACDVDQMLEVTKRVFVDIYSQDWFDSLRTDFTFFSSLQSMPPAPERGDFGITQVLESDYFFA